MYQLNSNLLGRLNLLEEQLWCSQLNSWVKVLERRELFGNIVATVWPEGSTETHIVVAETLSTTYPFKLEEALAKIAAARIWNALGTDLFLAPIISPVIPLPHQFRVLRQALSKFPIRLLLADEVGLGKTIEAGLIFKELKLRGIINRTLILAPKSLQLQWVAEMKEHFGELFELAEPGSWGLGVTINNINPWKRYEQVVTSFDSVKPRESQKGWSDEQIDHFNLSRFQDLIGAGWDLVIIDESHKVAGAGEDVARYELAKGIAQASPHLLLLSATPHSGKSDAFRRLLTLLDPSSFPMGTSLTRQQVMSFVIRTEKRTTVDMEGKALFTPRLTKLIKVPFQKRHALQKQLYEEVSEYIIDGYKQIQQQNNKGYRLLLILIQRLMSSSTRAIKHFLEQRLAVLNSGESKQINLSESIDDNEDILDDSEQLALFTFPALSKEISEVRNLLTLTYRVEQAGPDARAEALYDQMISLIQQDNEPDKKFIIFTEFTSTQTMLKEFLEQRGYSVATLNGSMSLEERKLAQEQFKNIVQVLISTDAGGEGLNLQFAHIVFNYDLPWNPMRVEQRIGRVDRIGQHREVKAFNLVLENSIEARIYEVLLEKLTIILNEFGVDKTGDVLDSQEIGAKFEALARTALLKPETFDSEFERVLVEIRTAAKESQKVKEMYTEKLAAVDFPPSIPIKPWLSTLLRNTSSSIINKEDIDLSLLVIENIKSLGNYFTPKQIIPELILRGMGFQVMGWFTLWKVGIAEGSWRQQYVFSMFLSHDGESYSQSAQRIWDALATRNVDIEESCEINDYDYLKIEQLAKQEACQLYDQIVTKSKEQIRQQKIALDYSYFARQKIIQKIRLESARSARKSSLELEYYKQRMAIEAAAQSLPDFRCLFFAKVKVE